MIIGSQSILNDNWYNRLRRGVTEEANVGIRRSGSEADDPFWRAREGQGMGDLAGQRQDAQRQLMMGGWASRAAGQDREKAYQQRASWGLRHMNPQGINPSTYLGVQGEEAGGGAGLGGFAGGTPPPMPSKQPNIGPGEPIQAPEAYRAPFSGGPLREQRSAGPYRPQLSPNTSSGTFSAGQFANPALDRRKKELDAYYARMAKGWR